MITGRLKDEIHWLLHAKTTVLITTEESLMKSEVPTLVVLIADDDEDDCRLVESAFQEICTACDLRFVDDGQRLLDYLYNEGEFADIEKYSKPNLVLLDLNMPRMNGYEALARIKSDPRLKNIPILILTTSREEHDIALSKHAGASSFLSKPEKFGDLTDALEKFCTAILHNPDITFRVLGC